MHTRRYISVINGKSTRTRRCTLEKDTMTTTTSPTSPKTLSTLGMIHADLTWTTLVEIPEHISRP